MILIKDSFGLFLLTNRAIIFLLWKPRERLFLLSEGSCTFNRAIIFLLWKPVNGGNITIDRINLQ
ncbi:MAG: hypothetical protein ACP5UV_02665, partial [Thermoplasmata archaeon]